jgi:trk system potassium uptake protein
MYIIVVGGGNVGFYLTKDLVAANHEVLLLEKDRVRAQRLAEELGTVVQQGDGCEAKVMAEMQFQKADIVVAVTGEDEDNLVVCQMAKKKFHVARTIARVNSPANEELFSQLGIDTTVSATRLIFNLIESEIQSDQPIPVAALARGNLEIVSIDLSERSPVVGRAVGEIRLPGDAHIVAIVRRGKGLLPSPHAILQTGDDVLALVNRDEEHSLRKIFCELQ